MKHFIDGDQLVITKDDFVNLQESPAVFYPLDSEIAKTVLQAGRLIALPLGELQYIKNLLEAGGPTPAGADPATSPHCEGCSEYFVCHHLLGPLCRPQGGSASPLGGLISQGGRIVNDQEHSLFFEVVCCFHPTKFDPVGYDGLYVKEVRRLSTRPTPAAPDMAAEAPDDDLYFIRGELVDEAPEM